MKLFYVDDDGDGEVIDVDSVGLGFEDLMERFDRDPDTGVDLVDAAPREVTARVIAGGAGGVLCMAMARATARIVARYRYLPADVMDTIDDHVGRLGVHWPEDASREVVDIAKGIVRTALNGDDEASSSAAFDVIALDVKKSAVHAVQVVFVLCCTLIATAKGR